MFRLSLFRALLTLMFTWAPPAIGDPNTLDVGVFPYFSTRALLELYEPVRVSLQTELNRPTHLFTAPSFKIYAERTQAGEYDVVVTPPHLARLAQREAGYLPLAIFTRELRGIVVVAKNSPIQTLNDLKGKRIGTPARIALVTIVGGQLLRDNGLVADMNILVRDMGSHTNAVLGVQSNEVDAALTETVAVQQMPEALRNSVRIIAQTQRLPHVMVLAHPRLGQSGIERIRNLLLRFPNTAEGNAFFKISGFEGLRAVEEADLKNVDPYIKELKRVLEAMPP